MSEEKSNSTKQAEGIENTRDFKDLRNVLTTYYLGIGKHPKKAFDEASKTARILLDPTEVAKESKASGQPVVPSSGKPKVPGTPNKQLNTSPRLPADN